MAEKDEVLGLAESLVRYLELCADHRKGDPEIFLWNARRSTEAMLMTWCLVNGGKFDGASGRTIEGILKQLKERKVEPPENTLRQVTTAQSMGNGGTHACVFDPASAAGLVGTAAPALCAVARWWVSAPLIKKDLPAPLGARVSELVEEISSGSRQALPTRDELETAERARLEAVAQVSRSEAELQIERLRLTPAPVVVQDRGALARVGALVAALCLPAGLAVGVGLGLVIDEGSLGTEPASAGLMVQATPPAPPSSAATMVVAEAPAVKAAGCPEGMVAFAEREIQIGQPSKRGGWPAPSPKKIDRKRVAAFCLDAAPTREAALRARSSTYRSLSSDCTKVGWRGPFDTGAATCVTRTEAGADCETRGLRLPSLLEWEVVARDAEQRAALDLRLDGEWIHDDFPLAVLNLPAAGWTRGEGAYRRRLLEEALAKKQIQEEGDVLFSWNQGEVSARIDKVGFRCAK
jgi:formylglycine-generating enzyme required for sulfatase activity